MPGYLGIVSAPDRLIDKVHMWYDASDASTITESGGSVSEWRDKAPGGGLRHLVQATGADKPITGVSTQNGRNVINFVAGDYMAFTGATGVFVDACTVFVVYKGLSPSQHYFDLHQGLTGTNEQEAGSLVLNTGGSGIGIELKRHNIAGLGLATYVTFEVRGFKVYTAQGNGQHVEVHIDGRPGTFTDNSGTTFLEATGGLLIGGHAIAGVLTKNFTGSIAEILVFDYVLTAAEMYGMECYLATKWFPGPVSLGIPGLHTWMAADDVADFTLTGTDVTAWRDRSTHERHMNIAIGTPSRTGSQNGLSTVIFTPNEGIRNDHPGGDGLSRDLLSLFIVAKISADGQAYLYGGGTTSATGPIYGPVDINATSGTWRYQHGGTGNSNTPFQSDVDTGFDAADGTHKLFHMVSTRTSLLRYLNLTVTGPNWVHTAVLPNLTRAGLAHIPRGASPIFSGGTVEIAEVIAYQRYLTPDEQDRVNSYLIQKWGL